MTTNLSTDEEKAISQLRESMKHDVPSEMYSDTIMFYKFLKARNFNVTQAEALLRKNIRWRKEMQFDTIQTDFRAPEVITKYYSQNMIGFDKEGCPIWYNAVGNTDSINLFRSCNERTFIKFVIQTIQADFSNFKSQSAKLRKPVNQIVCIYDLTNLTFAKATNSRSLQVFRNALNIFQDNFPEHLKVFYFINASLYFTLVIPIIQSVLANAVLNKIQIFGKDGWKEELLKCIDADVLPAFLGGNRTDSDGNPNCITMINYGGIIPESYYLVRGIDTFAKKDDTNYMRIERQGCFHVPLTVEKPKSIIHWEFGTKSHDIGFGLLLEIPNLKTSYELIPIHRIETENDPEIGMYRCDEFGIYKLVFDNSHSWFKSKELFYRVWVTTDTVDKKK